MTNLLITPEQMKNRAQNKIADFSFQNPNFVTKIPSETYTTGYTPLTADYTIKQAQASQALNMEKLIDMANSAAQKQIDFQREMTNQTNAFNKQEAEINRAFQQASADKAMQFSANEAEKARDFSSAEAAINRNWQEYMSNTAYQRAMKDMEKAGLNPILAAQTTSGASTPSGGIAHTSQGNSSSASGGQASGVTASGAQANIGSAIQAYSSLMTSMLSSASNLYSQVISADLKKYAADMIYKGTKYSSDKSFDANTLRSVLGLLDFF